MDLIRYHTKMSMSPPRVAFLGLVVLDLRDPTNLHSLSIERDPHVLPQFLAIARRRFNTYSTSYFLMLLLILIKNREKKVVKVSFNQSRLTTYSIDLFIVAFDYSI